MSEPAGDHCADRSDEPLDAAAPGQAKHSVLGLYRRLYVTPTLVVVGLVMLVVVILAVLKVSHLPRAIIDAETFHWPWALAAAFAVPLYYLGGAISLGSASKWRPSFPRLTQLQAGQALTLVVTPANLGGASVSLRFLGRAGLDAATGAAAYGLYSFLTSIVSGIGLAVAAAFAASTLDTKALKQEVPAGLWMVIVGILAIAVFVTVVIKAPGFRHRVVVWFHEALHYVRTVLEKPATGIGIVSGQLVCIAGPALCLGLLLHAVEAPVHPAALIVATQLASAASRTVPIPGGLGAPEAILIAALASTGVRHEDAIIVALAFRMLSYWLPTLPGTALLYDLYRRDLV